MLDVARDPRWGRIAEGPGEDPHVAAVYATAKIRAWQAAGIATTAKHFAAYAASRAGRDYAAIDVSPRTLAEVYLPPFRAAVEAGALAVMPAFTDIDGVPLTAHRGLLTGLLRDEWGFDGVVIRDYTAIDELVAHGVAADTVEAAALALNAGVDIDMMSRAYERGLPAALERGLVTIEAIDAAVARVLTLKERLGLFDDPYVRARRPRDADLAATRAARPQRRGPLDHPAPQPRRGPAASARPRPPRPHRPARRRRRRDARALGRRRPPRGGGLRPRRPRRRPARHPDRLRRRLPHRPPRRDRHRRSRRRRRRAPTASSSPSARPPG